MSRESLLSYTLTARYGDAVVLRGVSGTLARGEIAALVGLSGSGKSTMALALQRLLQYRGGVAEGSIVLEGTELMGLSGRGMRGVRGRRIGYVPQSPGSALNPKVRVRTLVEETWRAHENRRMEAGFAESLLARVQLPGDREFLDRHAGELSTGQGQRLLIALAILHGPSLLIADEPTSALDAITQAAVLRLFANLNRESGTAILFISHDLLSVAGIAHRVDILHEGTVVESGPPTKIFGDPVHPFTRALVEAMPRRP